MLRLVFEPKLDKADQIVMILTSQKERFWQAHQENLSVQLIPHYTPLLYNKTGVDIFSFFLILNIDCGYSLEPPRCGSSVYP